MATLKPYYGLRQEWEVESTHSTPVSPHSSTVLSTCNSSIVLLRLLLIINRPLFLNKDTACLLKRRARGFRGWGMDGFCFGWSSMDVESGKMEATLPRGNYSGSVVLEGGRRHGGTKARKTVQRCTCVVNEGWRNEASSESFPLRRLQHGLWISPIPLVVVVIIIIISLMFIWYHLASH